MTHLVVKARSTNHSRLLMTAAVVSVLLVAWGIFEFGRYRSGFDLIAVEQQRGQHAEQLAGLASENGQLREQIAILERSSQIEQEAYKQLETAVTGLQDEMLELKGELAFYRGIISPTDAAKGLSVQSFELHNRGEGRTYQYKLVLTQILNNDNIASGTVALVVEGLHEGETREYPLQDLSKQDGELRFRFKYFQIFEGALDLPEGFNPSKVSITVKPRTKSHKRLSQSYDWVVQES